MPEIIKAISLHQPYASLVALGVKKIETRHWRTKYRGRILICSTKKNNTEIATGIESFKSLEMARHYGHNEPLLPQDFTPLFGYALAVAELVGCRILREADTRDALVYAPGQVYGFRLDDIRAIEPFKVTGQRGIQDMTITDEIKELP